ncbi:13717_t:CDS:1 [Gigaspora margarita]|uniref:13717_t:CDS:1 n=1 Tax=Gigaspora margarita TaxID=4874 RepID=A0ABN7VJF7_GIGMA|nr:13717_t:CDS:1 [Gigaspora margarita]
MACQSTANMIIESIKTFIDQNAATQSAIIDKLNKCIDQCFDQLQLNKTQQQPLNQHGKVSPSQHNYDLDTTLPQQQFFSQQQEATHSHNPHVSTSQHKGKQVDHSSTAHHFLTTSSSTKQLHRDTLTPQNTIPHLRCLTRYVQN